MHPHAASPHCRVARRVKLNRMLTALALVFVSILPQVRLAAASPLSVPTCSMNGRMQSNREFWDRLKHKQAETAAQKLPKTSGDFGGTGGAGKDQRQENSKPVGQD